MHKEIKANSFSLYIEGEDISGKLLNYFEVCALEVSKFLQSNTLILKDIKNLKLECSLSFSDGESMRVLNKNFRQIDKVTDVLSFPVHESFRVGSFVTNFCENIELGDIIICCDVAKVQAHKFNISYEQEIIHLFVHGLLHLVGFDHEVSDEEEKVMNRHEAELVKNIYRKLGLEDE